MLYDRNCDLKLKFFIGIPGNHERVNTDVPFHRGG